MNSRGLVTTLLVCLLAWAVHGCAIVPWEPQEESEQTSSASPAPVQKAGRPPQPQKKAEEKRAAELPKRPASEPVASPPSPDLAPAPQPESDDRPWIDPDAEPRQGQDTAQGVTPEPKPAPTEPQPVAEPAQQQGPGPDPPSAPDQAQAAPAPEPIGQPEPPDASSPSPSPPAAEPTGAAAAIPETSPVEAAPEPKPAPEAPPAPPNIFSPEPLSERPAAILPPDSPAGGWFDQAFEHWRPEDTKIPRLLREPSPPPLRSAGEP